METVTPYIIIGSFCINRVRTKLSLTRNFVLRLVVLLLSILIFGQILTLIGIELPVIWGVPLTTELSQVIEFTRFRVSSFVGTSGPFSMALTYLLISLQILLPNRFFLIAILGTILEIISFSRLGLILFLTFNLIFLFPYLIKRLNLRINKPNPYTLVLSLIVILYFINYIQFENILIIMERITKSFDFVSDKGNLSRLDQWSLMITQVKANNIFSILFGDGTGITARALSGVQGESQILKIYVEWGLIGLILFTYWLIRSTNLYIYNNLKLSQPIKIRNIKNVSLTLTIILNCMVLQIFTSSPGFIAMGLAVLSLNVSEKQSTGYNKIKGY